MLKKYLYVVINNSFLNIPRITKLRFLEAFVKILLKLTLCYSTYKNKIHLLFFISLF